MNMGLKPKFCEPDKPWLHFSISKPLIWVPLQLDWPSLSPLDKCFGKSSNRGNFILLTRPFVFPPVSLVLFPLWLFWVLAFIPTSLRNHPWISSQFTSKQQTESEESPNLPKHMVKRKRFRCLSEILKMKYNNFYELTSNRFIWALLVNWLRFSDFGW